MRTDELMWTCTLNAMWSQKSHLEHVMMDLNEKAVVVKEIECMASSHKVYAMFDHPLLHTVGCGCMYNIYIYIKLLFVKACCV